MNSQKKLPPPECKELLTVTVVYVYRTTNDAMKLLEECTSYLGVIHKVQVGMFTIPLKLPIYGLNIEITHLFDRKNVKSQVEKS